MTFEMIAGCIMLSALALMVALWAWFATDFVWGLLKERISAPSKSRLEAELDNAMKKIELLELDQEKEDPAPTELEELILAHATLYPEWWEINDVSDYATEYLYPSLNVAIRRSVCTLWVGPHFSLRVDGMGGCAESQDTLKSAVRKIDAFIAKDHDERRDDAVADVVAKLREGA